MENNDGSSTDGTNGGAGTPTEKDSTLAVKVALNVRPLIGLERVQGCKDCITVVPGEPQVQLGAHSFTFDHVYGSTGTPMSAIFDECVAPLVDGLFQGFNATVLAYGQTGSGKTYTMGTGYTVGGSTEGVIPRVMETIFAKMESLQAKADFQIRVSFIEILKEEVHDLLDPSPPPTVRADLSSGAFGESKYSAKPVVPGKPPIQIRETTNGGITLAGVTETDVKSLEEMALCLEQGSLCRATGSTMMNTRSSRSHAIFTITLEQRRKWEILPNGANPLLEDAGEDYLCAKFHLVDLAGSERAKRTGADGVRFKEGVHINKGLLALGNVISALGDEKKRKEGGHVPYRDSKLTRLLQDSLGGNSRTLMIACVSPADSNAEETLNTLKYANRARNIQNKPTINRDPMAAEMSRMRQQLELMQAELLCARAGSAPEEVQLLKQKIVWLEASNADLRQELQEARNSVQDLAQQALDARVQQDKMRLKLDKLRAGKTFSEIDEEDDFETEGLLKEHLKRIQELEAELLKFQRSGASSRPHSALSALTLGEVDAMSTISGYTDITSSDIPNLETELTSDSVAIVAEDQAKEWEHQMLQENLDKELQELNKHLEQKELEMKTFVRSDATILKQHFERKLVELEEEKKMLQKERDKLVTELEKLATTSDEQTHKLQETYSQKLKDLETQIADLKKKQENQSQHLRAKQRADEAAKRLQEDIHRIKTQKVQLQQKIKQESEQFRAWKACREKELLQLKKEGRRNEYEMHKLQALHQRQKLVLQRKTEEAAVATRRLKELLEARRSPRDSAGHGPTGSSTNNERALQQWLDQELEMAVRVHEVRSAYEKQHQERSVLQKELTSLREEEDLQNSSTNQAPSMSPGARSARIRLLETVLNTSSSSLVAMASQLSEAEDRERISGGRVRWQHLRSMGDIKVLLQAAFDSAALSKCRVRDVDEEGKEMREKLTELEQLLRKSEARRTELERHQRSRDQPGVSTMTTFNMAGFDSGTKKEGDRKMKAGERYRQGFSIRSSDRAESGNDGLPWDLRKVGRDQTSNKYARRNEMSDSSEGELDMDTDSDEEWTEDAERQAVKRNRSFIGGFRISQSHTSKSMSIDPKLSSGSPHGQLHHNQEQESLGAYRASQPSSGETVLDDHNEDKGKEPRLYQCSCTCSQSSGCKTKKCECKAAGGLCGTQCGCNSVKCNNREAVAMEEEQSFSLADPIQMEVAQAVASAGVDKNCGRLHDQQSEAGQLVQGGESPVHIVTEEEHVTKRADRELAVHGASLIESAWNHHELQENADVRLPDADAGDDGPTKKTRRRPLKDIGNKVSTKGSAAAKQRTQKGAIQLVSVEPARNAGSGIAATNPSLAAAAAPAAAATNISVLVNPNPANIPTAAGPDILSPVRRQHSLQRRNSSGHNSPMRLRENKVGASNPGIGCSSDDAQGGAKNAKATGSAPGSPTGPGRGTDEKENIQRNSFV
ncbi:unnamed protein product [Calypogeia fissa]